MLKKGKVMEESLFHRQLLVNLMSYVVTCKKENQPEWMEGLVEEVNKTLKAIGADDRFSYFDHHGSIYRESGKDVLPHKKITLVPHEVHCKNEGHSPGRGLEMAYRYRSFRLVDL